jgi:hypothetical protein
MAVENIYLSTYLPVYLTIQYRQGYALDFAFIPEAIKIILQTLFHRTVVSIVGMLATTHGTQVVESMTSIPVPRGAGMQIP